MVADGPLRERASDSAGVDRAVDRHGQHGPRPPRRLPARHRPARQTRRLGTGLCLRPRLVQTLRKRTRRGPELRHGSGPDRLRIALSLHSGRHQRLARRHTAAGGRTRRHPRRRLVRPVDRMGRRDELRPAPPAGAIRLQPPRRHADLGARRPDMAGRDGSDRRKQRLPGAKYTTPGRRFRSGARTTMRTGRRSWNTLHRVPPPVSNRSACLPNGPYAKWSPSA